MAHAFDKDRHLLETEPDCLGAWLTIMPAGREASTLGYQAQDCARVVGWAGNKSSLP